MKVDESSFTHQLFLRTLNHVGPETYVINENQLISMYVYSSSQEAEKGIKDFEDKTEAASVEAHRKYQVANVLLFYVTDEESIDGRVNEMMEGLKVTK